LTCRAGTDGTERCAHFRSAALDTGGWVARTFLDLELMTWEVYPSAGAHGFSRNPHLVFNCLSNRAERPRFLDVEGDSASAQKLVFAASEAELRDLFARASHFD
jgi:hypothetical protein